MSNGIDYGKGQTNIDFMTGIRFGVIPGNSVHHWQEESLPWYGPPCCPICGEELESDDCTSCPHCGDDIDSNIIWDDVNPQSWYIENEEITAEEDDSGDIFVLRSEYYTYAQYCSPCAPGAVYLLNPTIGGARGYCFGHDWFASGVAPYPVYRVSDDSLCLIIPPKGGENELSHEKTTGQGGVAANPQTREKTIT